MHCDICHFLLKKHIFPASCWFNLPIYATAKRDTHGSVNAFPMLQDVLLSVVLWYITIIHELFHFAIGWMDEWQWNGEREGEKGNDFKSAVFYWVFNLLDVSIFHHSFILFVISSKTMPWIDREMNSNNELASARECRKITWKIQKLLLCVKSLLCVREQFYGSPMNVFMGRSFRG